MEELIDIRSIGLSELSFKENIKSQLEILRRTVDRGLVYAERNKESNMVTMCHHLLDEIHRTELLLIG